MKLTKQRKFTLAAIALILVLCCSLIFPTTPVSGVSAATTVDYPGLDFADYYDSVTGQWGYSVYVTDWTLTDIVIPAYPFGEGDLPVIEIMPYGFAFCSDLVSVTIPETVRVIGDSAFYFCSSLKDVYIEGAGLRTIENYAFSECNLNNFILPNTVTSWGASSFSGNPADSTLFARMSSLPMALNYAGTVTLSESAIVYDLNPDGVSYSARPNQLLNTNIDLVVKAEHEELPVTNILNGAFANCEAQSLVIETSTDGHLITIGQSAFANSNISAISLGNSANTHIFYGHFRQFENCYALYTQ